MDALTDAEIAEARRLYATGLHPSRIAEKLRGGRSVRKQATPLVRAILDLHPITGTTPPEKREQVVALFHQGLSLRSISRETGVGFKAVTRICSSERRPDGVKVRKRRRDTPSRPERRPIARKGRLIPVPEQVEAEVPAWVPDRLHELYASITERDCEEQAAIICRRLKHGASVAYV